MSMRLVTAVLEICQPFIRHITRIPGLRNGKKMRYLDEKLHKGYMLAMCLQSLRGNIITGPMGLED
jgi:hypothetical protein